MFGLLKPGCGLDAEARARHRRAYCGLCQGMGAHFGQGWRGLHSHDAVLIGLIADGLAQEAAPPSRTRCPMMPVVHRDTLAPESPAMRYATAIQVLLGDQWLADKSEEGNRLAGAVRSVVPSERAWALLDGLQVDLSALVGFEAEQGAVERSEPDLDAAAAPTREALGMVFGAIAELPGNAPEASELLAQIGREVGSLIYTCDALEDLEGDLDSGAFNPLLQGRRVDLDAVLQARDEVETRSLRLQEHLAELPLRRHRDLVETVLVRSLVGRTRRAAQAAVRFAESRPVPRRPIQRLSLAVAAMWTFVFVALSTLGRAARASVKLPRLSADDPQPEGICDHIVFCCCDSCEAGFETGCCCLEDGESCEECCGGVCDECCDEATSDCATSGIDKL